MNTDRNKYLTEAMGKKVRTLTSEKRKFNRVGGFKFIDFVCSCCDGPQSACGNYATDFSTWEGFGKLWEWAQEQEWWKQLVLFCEYGVVLECIEDTHKLFPVNQVDPDRFANAVYEFLKGRES